MFFRFLKANKALTISNMTRVYNSVIIPSLSYGVSFWFRTALFPSQAKKFISLQRKCLLAITGCYRTTSSVSLDILVGILPIMTRLEALHSRERLRVFGISEFNGFSFTTLNDQIQASDAEGRMNMLSKPAFIKFIYFRSIQQWESSWASSVSGRFTFRFFPTVSLRLSRPWFRARGPAARFISGHSLCESYLSRFSLDTRKFCTCDLAAGDLLHDLFYCKQFSKINFDPGLCGPEDLTAAPLYKPFLEFSQIRESFRRAQHRRFRHS